MTRIPSKDEILQWISANPTETAKRDIAKAFGIKGAARIDLKRILREMEDDGSLRKRKTSYREAEDLPPVSLVQIMAPDADGDLFARPLEWQGDGEPPRILMTPKDGEEALAGGDRVLARLTKVTGQDYGYSGRLIRRIGHNPLKIVGIYRKGAEGGRIMPIDKRGKDQWVVSAGAEGGARDGELVEAEQAGPKGRLGLPKARIVARLGDPSGPRAVSVIAIHQHNIPDRFPDAVIAEADSKTPADLQGREDLRDLPLVTIDPIDARDRDDAVLAIADDAATNPGGFLIWVAIADVAHYVTPGSDLDREARNRGNSTYFPDRVVPMLPDVLSGDLCSLHEHVARACLAVEMRIDARGQKIGHRFVRGLMQSRASLHYEEVQAGMDGAPSDKIAPLMDTVIAPLYAAYRALTLARETRQPLELDLPERKIELDDAGKVVSVAFKDRIDAHKLIEEFMVLANVAAAETLIAKKTPLLFRVHEEPSPQKLDALRDVVQASGLTLAKGQMLQTRHLNQLLKAAHGTQHDELINIQTLRAMTQAYYSPENFGHFGLALRNYAHFTSPIRRYSDLIVHRALITAHRWGKDGLSEDDQSRLVETAELISDTERRSMLAERDTIDRYLASYLSERVGAELAGRISGIAKFGVFVKLDDSGADAMIPIRNLGDEYFHYDPETSTLVGSSSGMVVGLGQKVTVKLTEAVPATGGLIVDLVTLEERTMPKSGSRGGRGAGPRRLAGKARLKSAKDAQKVKRRRHQ